MSEPKEPILVDEMSVAGADIEEVIHTRIGPAIDGIPVPLAVLSMVATICLILKPEIEPEKLQDAITSISHGIMLTLSDLPSGPKDLN